MSTYFQTNDGAGCGLYFLTHGWVRWSSIRRSNHNCTACDTCKSVCPNEAIAVGDPIYVIDPLRCTECVGAEDEPQRKLVCPADCIVPNPDFAEVPKQLMAKYASLHG